MENLRKQGDFFHYWKLLEHRHHSSQPLVAELHNYNKFISAYVVIRTTFYMPKFCGLISLPLHGFPTALSHYFVRICDQILPSTHK